MTKLKKSQKPSRKKSKTAKIFWAVVFLYVGYIFVQQQVRLHDLRVEEKQVAAEIKQAQSENEDLAHTKDIMESDEYIEKIARQKLGFVKPDEQVFVDTSR